MMGYPEFRQLVRDWFDARARFIQHRDNEQECRALAQRILDELNGLPARGGLFDRTPTPEGQS